MRRIDIASWQTRLEMTTFSCITRWHNNQTFLSEASRIVRVILIGALLLTAGRIVAQGTAITVTSAVPDAPASSALPEAPVAEPPATSGQEQMSRYVIRQTADIGGRIVGVSGSGAMYDTLVNLHSGPRVLGQTYTMHALPDAKPLLLDSLSAFGNGFGGDPINFARLSFFKGKLYEFTGTFRRDRQYFDYDLLGNPSIPLGISTPYGMVAGQPTAASLSHQQLTQSPVMFNTVRRMTDTSLTLLPLSNISFRAGYSQNIFQGPSLSPGYLIGASDQLLREYQRNSSDDFLASMTWKPLALTSITFEEQIDHYKADSYFTLAPGQLNVQEADGTPAATGNWDATAAPYSIASCNTSSMGSAYTNATNYTIFSAPQTAGGRPIVNPACNVTTNYLRAQPTRAIYPTEMLRFQSSRMRGLAVNGDLRYTRANSSLANYYEAFQGLDGAIRNYSLTGNAKVQRRVVSSDLGVTWQSSKTISVSDQLDFSNVRQPGSANITTGVTHNAPTTPGNETISYVGPLAAGTAYSIEGNPAGVPLYGYFGQRFLTNNATVTWDASPKTSLTFTYRYRTHSIVQTAGTGASSVLVTIHENGGIFNVALHPTTQWRINGTAEMLYDDNALTPIGPRQTKHYRIHTLYKLRPWATLSGALNDLERHNNTFNTGVTPIDGPLQHVDHTRNVGVGVIVAPNEHYGFDVNYDYSDIYISTNVCYLNGATSTLPGTASTTSSGSPNLCPGVFSRGSTTVLSDWGPTRDFMDAPTQYASVGFDFSPNKKIRTSAGYRISAVSGNQFFANAQQVNGSLQSAYQSPYFNVAWTLHPGLIWKANYDYFGYGEGGPSGAPFCSSSTSLTSVVLPCGSSVLLGPTGLKEPSSGLTAPRNMHANVLTLTIHYEF
ncbi:hypothetical protein [Granulicella paludicola]|uniref:hypothetical protein n=1 Tax=Granulicella paludicola TaxID=474951 RepID=UPI0021DF9146|nr:hypothetical protein [Granulicella paludicola]